MCWCWSTASGATTVPLSAWHEADPHAAPAVGVSVQSHILQLASSKLWGDAQFNQLDKLQVALPHPEATAALIKGGTEINAHFGGS